MPSVHTFSTQMFSTESTFFAPYNVEHTAHETDEKTSTAKSTTRHISKPNQYRDDQITQILY